MLSLEEIKRFVADGDISDERAKEIRSACLELASIVMDSWREEEIPPPDNADQSKPRDQTKKL